MVVGTPSSNLFFKIQDSSADIPVAAAVVEKADTVTQQKKKSMLVQFAQCTKTSKEERDITRVETETLITISLFCPTVTYLS